MAVHGGTEVHTDARIGGWAANPSENLPDLLDTALVRLAAGLPLTGTP
ncbi:hypothetical protein OG884_11250 [Streptosporangium sp. NBC_01755]|nr:MULTISPECIES: hypothetical protein [unclassified Streptosporangium]WSA26121.1 hypothetical protein OIE13_35425 [Streptosporangium sp. NBC_01810]WSD02449.1 hypothetical protein OG884_11250 [Streptosporangium sp. NBC_01755]